MLELAILGLLTEEPLHGYELKKQLADTLGFASGVSFGSLYPALGRLEAAGAVVVVEPATDAAGVREAISGARPAREAISGARPAREAISRTRLVDPTPRGRRGKKVYRITPAGRTLFEELLTAESNANDDDRVFALRLAFARHLPPDARLGMLERRRARLVERLARLRDRVRAGRDRLDGYGRTLAEHDREIVEHDLSWIDRLIATERARSAPAPTPTPTPTPAPTPTSAGPPAPSISALRRPTPGPQPYRPTESVQGRRPAVIQEETTP